MSDLENPTDAKLTELLTPGPDGSPMGTASGQLSSPQAGQEQPVGCLGLPLAQPANAAARPASGSPEQGELGLPDWPVTYCPHCKKDVKPRGACVCPICGRVLKGGKLAKKHPINAQRRDAYFAELVAEYQPDSLYLREACRDLADARERLNHARGIDRKRYAEEKQKHFEVLEASRKVTLDAAPNTVTVVRRVVVYPDGRQMTDDEFIANEKLRRRFAIDSPVRLGAEHGSDGHGQLTDASPTGCRYCGSTTERCAEVKETRLSAWRALHYLDPDEVRRRGDEATAEMLHQLPRNTWRQIGHK